MHAPPNHHELTPLRSLKPNGPVADIASPGPTPQRLTLVLAGITADDYLQWIRDPDPPAGTGVNLISARAAPLSDRIELELLVHGELLKPQAAAHAAGFPITPEVIEIRRTPLQMPAPAPRHLALTRWWQGS